MKDPFEKLNHEINLHMDVIEKCSLQTQTHGKLLLASTPESRYPYVYPRDCGAAAQLLRRVAGSRKRYDAGPQAFLLLESMASFMKDTQSMDGIWGQRYNLQGEDKSIYKQEDNIAHGIAILCNYLLTAHRLKKDIPALESYLESIIRALQYSIENLYHKELNLFYSTTAIHESAIERGYTIWVNFSFLYAFSLACEVAKIFHFENKLNGNLLEFRQRFLYSISELFMSGNRYVRRIDLHGYMDMRPDFTLLSPFYFGFLHYQQEMARSVTFLEKQLYDPELGLIMRYLPFYDDFSIHVHAGNGPWLQYSAILAQYHYWAGNTLRGDEILNKIDFYMNDDREIPEHLSTCKRFENFMTQEWKTGLDFAKEFDKEILLEGVDFDNILEEANNMSRSYAETAKKCMILVPGSAEGGFIRFATTLMWSHVEYLRARMVRAGDWWRLNHN